MPRRESDVYCGAVSEAEIGVPLTTKVLVCCPPGSTSSHTTRTLPGTLNSEAFLSSSTPASP